MCGMVLGGGIFALGTAMPKQAQTAQANSAQSYVMTVASESDSQELSTIEIAKKAGETIRLTVVRNLTNKMEVSVTLGEEKPN